MGWCDMENLKVRVDNEAESKEVQELFFWLGADHGNGDKNAVLVPNIMGLAVINGLIDFVFSEISFSNIKQCKELTIQQLRDKVILKRNDVADANYMSWYGDKYYVASDLGIYIWQHDSWCCHCIQGDIDRIKNMERIKGTGGDVSVLLKPIEKEMNILDDGRHTMKEFLVKKGDEWVLELLDSDTKEHWRQVVVPDGAEIFTTHESDGDYFYKRNGERLDYFTNRWEKTCYEPNNFIGEMASLGRIVVWERDKKIDVAESKYAHYKKDVSHLKNVDVYRVLELFEVESHAVGHAIKKLLLSGGRGAKNEAQDIQEAIDSLIRYQEMKGEDNANT